MLLRLAALGTLGYVGYKYIQKNGGVSRLTDAVGSLRTSSAEAPDLDDPHVAMAGGPLSDEARVIHAGDPLPA